MTKRLVGRDVRELAERMLAERAAGCRQDQAGDRAHLFAGQALPDRRVLRIDRPEPGEGARRGVVRVEPGLRSPACARARAITRWPPATSVSLLAVATTLPRSRAASVGLRLTTPPVATITRSTSGRVASSMSWSGPPTRSVPAGRSRPARAAESARATAAGRQQPDLLLEEGRLRAGREGHDLDRIAQPEQDVDRLPADRATRSEQGDAQRLRAVAGHRRNVRTNRVITGRREQERVDPIEDAAVARNQVARALRAGGPLEHRLGQVAALRREADERAEDEPDDDRLAGAPQAGEDDNGRGDEAAEQPGVRLRGRDVLEEPLPADQLPEAHTPGAADQVGPGVIGPDRQDQDHHPGPLATEDLERGSGRNRGRAGPEADDEGQQADVQGPEDRPDPGIEAVARIGPGERAGRRQHDPDRREDRAAAGEDRGHGRVDDDRHRDRDAEPGQRRVARELEEPEGLDPRQDRQGDHRQGDPPASEDDDDDERRHEEQRAPAAFLHGPARYRPNRRSRLA